MAQKFKAGDKVKLKSNIPASVLLSYGLEVGDEGTVVRGYNGYYNINIYCRVQERVEQLSFDVRYLDLVKSTSREKIESKIESIKAEMEKQSALIAELNSKLKYMDEVGSDTFDENEFKAYQTLTIIEKGNLSKLEKAKAIAQLLNQK